MIPPEVSLVGIVIDTIDYVNGIGNCSRELIKIIGNGADRVRNNLFCVDAEFLEANEASLGRFFSVGLTCNCTTYR